MLLRQISKCMRTLNVPIMNYFYRFKTTGLLRQHQKSHDDQKYADEKIDVGEPLVMTNQGYLQAPPRHR